jgi:hypothetical protein
MSEKLTCPLKLSQSRNFPSCEAAKRDKSYHNDGGRMGFAYLACIPLIHTEIYAVAVAAVCWLKRPVASATIAMVSYAVLQSILGQTDLRSFGVFNHLEYRELTDGALNLLEYGYPIVYGVVSAVAICAAVIAGYAAANLKPTQI